MAIGKPFIKTAGSRRYSKPVTELKNGFTVFDFNTPLKSAQPSRSNLHSLKNGPEFKKSPAHSYYVASGNFRSTNRQLTKMRTHREALSQKSKHIVDLLLELRTARK